MNSSQIQSSDSASQDRIDFQRFQGIWNNIKKAKQSSAQSNGYEKQSSNRKSIISVKKAIEEQQQKNIETRLILTEKQLNKAKQNTTLLLKKLSEAQEQIEYLEYELQKQSKQKQQIFQQVEELRKYQIKRQRQKTSELQKSTIREHQTQSEHQKMSRKLQSRQREVDKLSLKIQSLQLTIKNQQNQIKLLNQNARIFQKKIQDTERSLIFNESSQNMRGAQLLQLQQAYNTIERLTILLRSTEQYKSFTLAIQDFKNGHFLKNIQQKMRKNQLIQKGPTNKKMCACMDIKIDEKMLWTPTICYKKLLQLKIKYGSMTEQCIEQILFELNRIYLSKQQNAIRNIKQVYQFKVNELKKKTQMRYDEMVARKQIERLKKQVQTEKYSKMKINKNSEFGDNIQILKTIGQYEDELKLKQKQIQLLKQRIRLIQTENNSYDKILYLEGTLWILDKILIEVQATSEDLQMFESKFRERINDEMSDQDWMNSFKYFFQNITEIQNNQVQKLLSMKQSTVKKMGTHRDNKDNQTFQLEKENSFGQ